MSDSLARIKKDVQECRRCSFPRTGKYLVFDKADKDVKVVMIGEAPGGHEVWESGRPFSGQAGKILEEMLDKTGLSREEIYIANAVKCRPVKQSKNPRYGSHANRRPTVRERENCRVFLERELKILSPQLVVTLGAVPFAWFAGKPKRLADVHGKLFYSSNYGLFVFSLYHPAGIMYNRTLRDDYLRDLEKLNVIIGQKGDITYENICDI